MQSLYVDAVAQWEIGPATALAVGRLASNDE